MHSGDIVVGQDKTVERTQRSGKLLHLVWIDEEDTDALAGFGCYLGKCLACLWSVGIYGSHNNIGIANLCQRLSAKSLAHCIVGLGHGIVSASGCEIIVGIFAYVDHRYTLARGDVEGKKIVSVFENGNRCSGQIVDKRFGLGTVDLGRQLRVVLSRFPSFIIVFIAKYALAVLLDYGMRYFAAAERRFDGIDLGFGIGGAEQHVGSGFECCKGRMGGVFRRSFHAQGIGIYQTFESHLAAQQLVGDKCGERRGTPRRIECRNGDMSHHHAGTSGSDEVGKGYEVGAVETRAGVVDNREGFM